MNWLSSLFSKYSRSVHFAAIIILSLALILSQSKVSGTVSDLLIRTVYYPFGELKAALGRVTRTAAENAQLQATLTNLSNRLTACERYREENQRLRRALGFVPPDSYSLLPARIIAMSQLTPQLPQSAVIDKGIPDSILKDQPIVNQLGLVGRVYEVEATRTFVQLLTDPSNRVAARVARSNEAGMVRYTIPGGLILDNFPIQGDIRTGDTILSSGLGGVYPPKLMVGTVDSVYRPPNGPFCRIWLQPAVNFRSLEEVFILKRNRP